MGFSIKKWFKENFGPKLSEIEKETEVHDVALLADVKKALDANGDGVVNVDDTVLLMKKYLIDKNGNGKVEIWEYIGFFFTLRNAYKKIKG